MTSDQKAGPLATFFKQLGINSFVQWKRLGKRKGKWQLVSPEKVEKRVIKRNGKHALVDYLYTKDKEGDVISMAVYKHPYGIFFYFYCAMYEHGRFFMDTVIEIPGSPGFLYHNQYLPLSTLRQLLCVQNQPDLVLFRTLFPKLTLRMHLAAVINFRQWSLRKWKLIFLGR